MWYLTDTTGVIHPYIHVLELLMMDADRNGCQTIAALSVSLLAHQYMR